jgi:hypothetical protein
MLKLLSFGLCLLISLDVLAQRPTTLDAFTSPDSAFQFLYPDNYELLVGENILKATQGRHLGFVVCDFSRALVCVVYPIERLEDDKFEGAGFSAEVLPAATIESDCLAYANRFSRPEDEHSQPAQVRINGRMFHHVSVSRRMTGHAQSSDLYRTFHKDRCYELRIDVSFSEQSTTPPRVPSKLPEAAAADSARESLKLILSSVVFN